MLKKPSWSAIETTLFYYSGDMYSWSSLIPAAFKTWWGLFPLDNDKYF